MRLSFSPLAAALLFVSLPCSAQNKKVLTREAEVPAQLAFVRTLDVDTFVTRQNYHGLGAQSFRIRTRYLDPDVNAFVGLLAGVHRFNRELRIGDPAAPNTSRWLCNWGADIGLKRGQHLWELDLMGTVLGSRLGPALAIVGEHTLSRRWTFYHRTEVNSFKGDGILDADQGFYWQFAGRWQLSAGYRWFTTRRTDYSGVHAGLRFLFENPRIPFLFPSLG